MTPKQKNYFIWLVLKNTERIVSRSDSVDGSRIIDKALDRFISLGNQMIKRTPESMREESIRILGRLLGVPLQPRHFVSSDLDEPF